jgi:nucleotide-binding universal stress UspA family protein
VYQRILVPVDGSPASLRGLDEAVNLARATGAALRLVHIVNEFFFDAAYTPSPIYEPLRESLRIDGQRVVARAQATVRQAGVEFESNLIETVSGRVSDLILADAGNWQADLIVMGTHGRRGIARLTLGSDAEMVLRSASIPVLLVRWQPEPP